MGSDLTDKWPDGFYFIEELRRAAGLFDGAMSKTPQEAWEEAIEEVRLMRRHMNEACFASDNPIREASNGK